MGTFRLLWKINVGNHFLKFLKIILFFFLNIINAQGYHSSEKLILGIDNQQYKKAHLYVNMADSLYNLSHTDPHLMFKSDSKSKLS